MREEHAVAGRALDSVPYGLVVLTRENCVRVVNEPAAAMLARYYDGPPRRGDRLPEDLERWVRHQRAEVGETAAPGRPRAPLAIGRGGHTLIIRLAGGGDDPLLLLEEQRVPSPHALLPLGLTRREADVMTWVVQGKTNAEIATIVGASPYTVIKHLQHVFAKLGVRTRTAAAARVLNALTAFRA